VKDPAQHETDLKVARRKQARLLLAIAFALARRASGNTDSAVSVAPGAFKDADQFIEEARYNGYTDDDLP